MKKRYWIILTIVALFILILIISGSKKSTPPENIDWETIRAQDVPAVQESGWGVPQLVQISSPNWEDSAYIYPDSQTLSFDYYPGDLITSVARGQFTDDLDSYLSNAPFTTKTKDTRFYLAEDIWSEAGVMIDGNDTYYSTNRNLNWANDRKSDQNIYLNDVKLAFNDVVEDSNWGNPHYCAALDELWFDEDDKKMWILKDAKANNFTGTPELAPSPLQVNSYSNFQPFLTPDCNTMYFTTNRGDISGIVGPAIYKSTRTLDNSWTNPQVVIYSKIGVGEPTMPLDGSRLYFVQLLQDRESKTYNSDIFYVERN